MKKRRTSSSKKKRKLVKDPAHPNRPVARKATKPNNADTSDDGASKQPPSNIRGVIPQVSSLNDNVDERMSPRQEPLQDPSHTNGEGLDSFGADLTDDEECQKSLNPHDIPAADTEVVLDGDVQSNIAGRRRNEMSVDGIFFRKVVLEMERRVNGRLDSLQEDMTSKLAAVERSCSRISSDVSTICTVSIGSENRKTLKRSEKLKRVEASLVLFEAIFTDEIFQCVVQRCLLEQISGLVMKKPFCRVRQSAAQAVRVFMFSKLPSEKRSLYKEGVGKEFSRYRRGVVLTTLLAVQNNCFGQFVGSSIPPSHGCLNRNDDGHRAQPTVSEQNSKLIVKPVWATIGYISKEDVEMARKKMEDVHGRAESDRLLRDDDRRGRVIRKDTEQMTKIDVSQYAASKLYQAITSKLHRARDMAKASFFEEIGYAFVPWSEYATGFNQENMTFKWGHDDLSEVGTDLDSIGDGIVHTSALLLDGVNPSEFDSNRTAAYNKNMAAFSKLMENNPDMVLFIDHEVRVRKIAANGTVQGRKVSERKHLRKAVNVIDVACRFIACYSGVSSIPCPSEIFSTTSDSLRCVYALSVFFKELLSRTIDTWEKDGLTSLKLKDDDDAVEVYSVTTGDLLPTPTRQGQILRNSCLILSADEYRKMDISENADDDETEPERRHLSTGRAQDDVIVANAVEGVFVL